jgi:hypothetical protein
MEAFIVKARDKHGFNYEYPPQPFKNMTTEINVICAKHKTTNHITPSAHLRNDGGCKQCSIEKRRLTMSQVIEKANKKHDNFYKYYANHIYLGATKPITVYCPNHGDFVIQGGNHLNGHGCQTCSRDNSAKLRSLTIAEVIQRTKNVHEDDYYIDPEQEYTNSHTPIKVICKTHDEFTITPQSIMCGYGCKKCANEQNAIRKMSNLPDFIAKSIIIHNILYTYDTEQEYAGYKKKLKITCKTHGDFYQFPAQHLSGQGCRKCAYDKRADLFRSNILEFIEKSNVIHSDRYEYDDKQEYVDSYTPVKVICPEHGEFIITPTQHLRGRGCRVCFHQISKPANEWLASVEKNIGRSLQTNNSPEGEFRIKQPNSKYYYYADGYDVITNTIYEFLGDFWHGNPNIYPPEFTSKNHKKTMGQRYADTLRKKETYLKLGFKYVEMWESDFINK